MSKYNWRTHSLPVIGVDEVGRGCLAGDVYAAAVCLDLEKDFSQYTDSKKTSEKRREIQSQQIHQQHSVSIACATVEEIFELNILKASLLAMRRAVLQLNIPKAVILVDGKFPIPDMPGYEQICLIQGDSRAEPIAAASIVAKVARDNELKRLAEVYPGYGLEKHKGYGTAVHRKAIAELGPSEIHRKAFAGVKEHLSAGSAG